jgi:outer membrane protein assembly factor BamB
MWEAEQVFVGHGAPVYCCAWDGTMVYSAAGDKFITRWSIETGKQDNFAIRLDAPAYTIAVFQGKLFAGLTNGTLICIDLASRELLWEKNFFGNPWFCIEFTAISDFMIAGDSEGNLLVLNLLGEKIDSSYCSSVNWAFPMLK